ncbi:Aspartyl protease AED3 [Linum perenne]
MNTQIFILFFFIFFIFFILTSSSPNCNEDPEFENGATTLKVYHISSPCSTFHNPSSLSWEQSVLQLQAKDQARVLYLSSLVAKKSVVPIASGRQVIQSPTYVLRAKIGTPAQTMMVALDTSNDAAWFPCKGCVGCSSSSSSSSVFDSSASSSFMAVACQAPACKQVPNPTCGGGACVFNMTYGGSSLSANLSTDTITLAADSVPGYTFGCIQKATGSSIPPFKSGNFSGSLKLGPVGQPKKIKFTPLLKNPRRSSLYYVNLNGVRVGKKVVEIPASALAFDAATGAGTIIDSGTVFTRLVTPAYTAVRDEFRKRVGPNATVTSLGGFDTCYSTPIVAPTITLLFAGMNVTLPEDNILIHSTAGSTSCLAMAAAPDNVNSVVNVIANMQQQNHRVFFDVANSRVGVSREKCT